MNNRRRRVELTLEGSVKIKDDLSIKILGWWLSPDGKLTQHINRIEGPIFDVLSKIKPILRHLNMTQRYKIVYSSSDSIN